MILCVVFYEGKGYDIKAVILFIELFTDCVGDKRVREKWDKRKRMVIVAYIILYNFVLLDFYKKRLAEWENAKSRIQCWREILEEMRERTAG